MAGRIGQLARVAWNGALPKGMRAIHTRLEQRVGKVWAEFENGPSAISEQGNPFKEELPRLDECIPLLVKDSSLPVHKALRRGDLSSAFDSWRTNRFLDLPTYTRFIALCREQRRFALARQLYDEMPIASNLEIFQDLIFLCYLKKDLNEALELFDAMQNQGIAPSLDIFRHLIALCTSEESLARSLFAEMRESGIEPDLHIYKSLISAELQAGQIEHAIRLFQQMLQEGISPDREIANLAASWDNEGVIAILQEREFFS